MTAATPAIAGGPDHPAHTATVVLELLAVFLVVLAVLVCASLRVGLSWDEATYFRYADSVRAWWREGAPVDAASLARYWAYDTYTNPHPPFMKTLVAAGTAAGTDRWLPFPTGYRFPHLTWIAGCLTAVYALVRREVGVVPAVAALSLVALQPRVFGHLLIASSDSPVAVAWLLLVLLAARLAEEAPGRRRQALWVAFGALLGCATATKITGFLAVLPLAGFFLWRRRWTDGARVGAAALWALAFLVLASPQLWHRPLAGIVDYVSYPFVRQSMPLSTAYLGQVYRGDLPWHYFLVMSLVTMPPLVLMLLPAAALAPGGARRLLPPLGFALAFWLLLVHLPGTPRHDEVRQFVTVYPLLGMVAWAALLSLLARVRDANRRWAPPWASAAACLAVTVWLGATVVRSHPFELSYYNRLIGGVRGAERAGMELSLYWEALDDGMLAAMNHNMRPGQSLFMSPHWPQLLQSYVDHGLLHAPVALLPPRSPERPDWLLLLRRRYFIDDRVFVAMPAVHEVRYDGVPLLKLVRAADLPGPVRRRP